MSKTKINNRRYHNYKTIERSSDTPLSDFSGSSLYYTPAPVESDLETAVQIEGNLLKSSKGDSPKGAPSTKLSKSPPSSCAKVLSCAKDVCTYGGLACSAISSTLGFYAWWYSEDSPELSGALETAKYASGSLAIALTIVGSGCAYAVNKWAAPNTEQNTESDTEQNTEQNTEQKSARGKLADALRSKSSAAIHASVLTLSLGTAVSLAIDPTVRSAGGYIMLGLSNAGAILAIIGYVDTSAAKFTSTVDNMVEGGSLGLVTSKSSLGADTFSGLVAGCASGYIGGVFLEKYGKMDAGHTKSAVWFFARGASMEFVRSALVAGGSAGVITDYKVYGVKAAINVLLGGLITALQGPTLKYQNKHFEISEGEIKSGKVLRGTSRRFLSALPLGFVANTLFQVGLPITEQTLHELATRPLRV